jgi:ferritin heavy chain
MPLNDSWDSGIDALKDALKLEAHVTRKIRDIITVCENPSSDGTGFNDYHVCFII